MKHHHRRHHRQRSRQRRLQPHHLAQIRRAQQTETTEALVYNQLAKIVKDKHNQKVLRQIAQEEKRHAQTWEQYSQTKFSPNKFKSWWYVLITRLLGLNFGVKLLERNEENAQINYEHLSQVVTEAKQIKLDEEKHEQQLIGLIDEESLKYVGSMVLGVNDALVELTGALAGPTLALQNGRLIAITGLITGIAASFSMAASEYLATKAEAEAKNPLKAAVFTGVMYFITVILLISPYFLNLNVYLSLAITLVTAVLIILTFTFYISIAQDKPFKGRFIEMVVISLGVASLSFGIGYLVNAFLGIEA